VVRRVAIRGRQDAATPRRAAEKGGCCRGTVALAAGRKARDDREFELGRREERGRNPRTARGRRSDHRLGTVVKARPRFDSDRGGRGRRSADDLSWREVRQRRRPADPSPNARRCASPSDEGLSGHALHGRRRDLGSDEEIVGARRMLLEDTARRGKPAGAARAGRRTQTRVRARDASALIVTGGELSDEQRRSIHRLDDLASRSARYRGSPRGTCGDMYGSDALQRIMHARREAHAHVKWQLRHAAWGPRTR